MHSRAGRICNHHVGPPVLCNERRCQHIFHVSCKKTSVANTVQLSIDLCVFNRTGNVLYPNHLSCVTSNEMSNGSRPGVQVIYKLISLKTSKIPSYLIELICL